MTNQQQWRITMDQLNHPESWDVPKIIADISGHALASEDGAAAAACIDNLLFAILQIDKLIRTGPIISPETYSQACEISRRFVPRSAQ